MAWRSITTDDVQDTLTAGELNAYRSAALANGQTDPLPRFIANAVSDARARIAACRSNNLGPADTVPDGIRHHVLAIVRYRLTGRLPIPVTEQRETEYKDSLRFLKDVAACNVAIEEPEVKGDEEISSPGIKTVRAPKRRFTREDMQGL